ncbi:MAG: hypothetical protein ABSE47_04070 [Acidimicrobiales bacterium]
MLIERGREVGGGDVRLGVGTVAVIEPGAPWRRSGRSTAPACSSRTTTTSGSSSSAT